MTAVAQKEVTTRQVSAVHFGFYSDEEVILATQSATQRSPVRASHSSGRISFGFQGLCARGSRAERLCRHSLQVRKLSVKRIVQPLLFDGFNNPMPGGLYDPDLGPLDRNSRWDRSLP